jgi:hypothetical protein
MDQGIFLKAANIYGLIMFLTALWPYKAKTSLFGVPDILTIDAELPYRYYHNNTNFGLSDCVNTWDKAGCPGEKLIF